MVGVSAGGPACPLGGFPIQFDQFTSMRVLGMALQSNLRSLPYRKLFRKKIPTNRDHERQRQKEQEGDEKATILE